MTNKIEVFEFNKELTVQENVKSLITTKANLMKAINAIDQVAQIYSDEIKEETKNMHMTREGNVIFISEMTENHLLFTIRILVKAGHGYNSAKTKRYMTEVKKRGLVKRCLEVVGEDLHKNEEDDDFILSEDEFLED